MNGGIVVGINKYILKLNCKIGVVLQMAQATELGQKCQTSALVVFVTMHVCSYLLMKRVNETTNKLKIHP